MKRIIELPDKVVEAIQNGEDYRYDIHTAIAHGTPYNPSGDCISREALKEKINATDFDFGDYYDNTEEIRKRVCETIDNAQAVDLWQMRQEATENALKKAKVLYDRPQGEWKTVDGYDGDEYYECSNCGEPWFLSAGTPKDNNMNFCPNCGAEMKGGAE